MAIVAVALRIASAIGAAAATPAAWGPAPSTNWHKLRGSQPDQVDSKRQVRQVVRQVGWVDSHSQLKSGPWGLPKSQITAWGTSLSGVSCGSFSRTNLEGPNSLTRV